MTNIFQERRTMLPYEYPELIDFIDAITHSYWIHSEFNYTSDIQDFKTRVTDKEADTLKRALTVIAQMEMSVEDFWGDLGKVLPKPEIKMVGATHAESEVRHARAYAHLTELLGLQSYFTEAMDEQAVTDRLEYLEDIIDMTGATEEEKAKKILTFGLFVEFVSLFSQFFVIMSYKKHRNLFEGVSNVVAATSKEEQIHGLTGVTLIDIIRRENPEWFDESFEKEVHKICEEVLKAEEQMLNWIFKDGDLDFVTYDDSIMFVKNRINNSLKKAGFATLYELKEEDIEKASWFDDEIIATKHNDFFVSRSVNYSKKQQSVTVDDLFEN